jgi:hypothetical protein
MQLNPLLLLLLLLHIACRLLAPPTATLSAELTVCFMH